MIWCTLILGVLGLFDTSWSQDEAERIDAELGDKYDIGADKHLQIMVHIWGEVRRPGQLRVRDTTNILELISMAGGPTQYANLRKVELTRVSKRSSRFLIIDLEEYLRAESYYEDPPPVLEPGDIVRVPQNTWYTWRSLIRIASEIIVITRLYGWLSDL